MKLTFTYTLVEMELNRRKTCSVAESESRQSSAPLNLSRIAFNPTVGDKAPDHGAIARITNLLLPALHEYSLLGATSALLWSSHCWSWRMERARGALPTLPTFFLTSESWLPNSIYLSIECPRSCDKYFIAFSSPPTASPNASPCFVTFAARTVTQNFHCSNALPRPRFTPIPGNLRTSFQQTIRYHPDHSYWRT